MNAVATIRSSPPLPQRFVARQPILNVRRDVVGYELLFRAGWENCFSGDSDAATREILDNCLHTGIDSLAGGLLAFVNCTRDALVGRLVTLLPPATTVLEILETIEPDAEVVEACRELHAMGYRLALDDFVMLPGMQPLIEIASYIKVDFRASDAAERRQILLGVRGSGAALLAEKVEDEAEFQVALAEGYQYFQGYFFCRPAIVANHSIPANRMNYLRLMVELTRRPLNLREVVEIVRQEQSLLYRLLCLANSALWGRSNTIASIREAFMLVGEDRFRILVAVAASCVLGGENDPALISLSLQRARFCELLAPRIGENPTEQFMLGLLSLVDSMLNVPMANIVNTLPLRAEARAALLGADNPAGAPLRLIRCLELGAWPNCTALSKPLRVSEEDLAQIYMEAVQWAGESLTSSRQPSLPAPETSPR
jgi:EAL and modified HD-GYP domain-containing signal transduction protein